MVEVKFNLSDQALQLLKDIKNKGYAEYRDNNHNTVEDFLISNDHLVHKRSLESFLDRNFNGTYHLIAELSGYNLVDSDEDSWHPTYVLTEFGKEVLKQF